MTRKHTHAYLSYSKWVKDELDTLLQIFGGKKYFKKLGHTHGNPWYFVYTPKTNQSLPHYWILPTPIIKLDENLDDQHPQNKHSFSNLGLKS